MFARINLARLSRNHCQQHVILLGLVMVAFSLNFQAKTSINTGRKINMSGYSKQYLNNNMNFKKLFEMQKLEDL